MSQSGALSSAQPGTGDLLTLQGDTGGIIVPDNAGNISIVSQDTDFITVIGNNGNATLTLQGGNRISGSYNLDPLEELSIGVVIPSLSAGLYTFKFLATNLNYSNVYMAVGDVSVINGGVEAAALSPFMNESSGSNFDPFLNIQTVGNELRFISTGDSSVETLWKYLITHINIS